MDMNITRNSVVLAKVVGVGIMLKAISLYKISFILGSQTAFFNGSSVAIPLVGFFAGPIGSVLLFLVRLGNWHLFTSGSLHLLSFVVPGFCASLYWTTKSSLIRWWLPLICMGAFIAHPVGHDAFVYTFYWFIPLTLFFYKRDTLWTQALGSTFVAHAVGSVIWLYTVPTTAAMWITLLPIVAVERLLCVAGMASICYAAMIVRPALTAMSLGIQTALNNYKQA